MNVRSAILVVLTCLPVFSQSAPTPAMQDTGASKAGGPAAKPAPTRSEMLTVTVAGTSRQFTVEDLKRLRQTEINALNGHTKRQETYRGVLVSDVLAAAAGGVLSTQSALRSYVRSQGTDFYWVLYSGAELDPAWHNGSVIVALERDGQALGESGRFQLVSTDDTKPARWVRNLNSLTSVPLN